MCQIYTYNPIAVKLVPFVLERGSYGLAIRDTDLVISGLQTIAECGVKDGNVIFVVAPCCAAGENINATFLYPTNGKDIEVEIDEDLTASAMINELIAANFIPDNASLGGYKLLIKDTQTEIGDSQTAASGGAKDGSVIRIIGATRDGSYITEISFPRQL